MAHRRGPWCTGRSAALMVGTRRVDFSGNAAIYDQRHGAAVDENGLRRICEAARLAVGSSVLDIGAGTGRVAIPLSDLGYAVVALEPAVGMLEKLRVKAGGRQIRLHQAAGTRLPVETGSVDAAVVARLLYLTPDWRQILDEVHRALKPDGVLLHEWGNGTFDEPWVQIREKARTLFEGEGMFSPFHPGAREESDIDKHLVAVGFHLEARLAVGSGPVVALREFLRRLMDGELSYIWDVPNEIRAKCLPLLQLWAEESLDLDRVVPVPKQIEWAIYRVSK